MRTHRMTGSTEGNPYAHFSDGVLYSLAQSLGNVPRALRRIIAESGEAPETVRYLTNCIADADAELKWVNDEFVRRGLARQ